MERGHQEPCLNEFRSGNDTVDVCQNPANSPAEVGS